MAPILLNRAASSAGMASAPDIQTRTDFRSRSSAPASSSIRYIAGTPMKRLARRLSIASSTRTGLKRGRKHTGTPAHAIARATANPMMWAIGRLTTAVSWRMPAGEQRADARHR